VDRSSSLQVRLYADLREAFNRNRLTALAVAGFVTAMLLAPLGIAMVATALGLTIVLHTTRDRRWLILGVLVFGIVVTGASTLADDVEWTGVTWFSAYCFALVPLLAWSLHADPKASGGQSAAGVA
jgi:hypothetical protein